MNKTALSTAIRNHAERFGPFDEETGEPTGAEVRDVGELLRVLARLVEGKELHNAFGAPGDWGYGTPIGDALAGRS